MNDSRGGLGGGGTVKCNRKFMGEYYRYRTESFLLQLYANIFCGVCKSNLVEALTKKKEIDLQSALLVQIFSFAMPSCCPLCCKVNVLFLFIF